MPASRRARKPPPRARKAKRRARSNLTSLLLDIEQPLRDDTQPVEALRLVGHGLVLHAGGDAVAELARIAGNGSRSWRSSWDGLSTAKPILRARA
jgi:hypothetical protein